MNKKVEIRFSDDAIGVYNKLKEKACSSKVDLMLLNAIERKINIIKTNVFYGDIIPKKLIPEEYKEKYDISTLLRVELPCFWRMLYSVGDNKENIIIIAFIIDILDHKKYNKKFGYKKK